MTQTTKVAPRTVNRNFAYDDEEVMAVVQTAMLAGMPSTGLRDAILAHPTMAEGLGDLFAEVPPAARD
jgi:hypothetical protein